MLQVKGLGSTIRDVLASGAARFGVPSSSETPSTGRAAQDAPVQRSAETNPTQSFSPSERIDPNRVDQDRRRGQSVQTRPEEAAPQGATEDPSGEVSSQAQGLGAGGLPAAPRSAGQAALGGRESAFQAQRIAQEVVPDGGEGASTGQQDGAEVSGASSSGGFSALARKVASGLYGFVRDAVGRGQRDDGPTILVQDGYPGRVDIEA